MAGNPTKGTFVTIQQLIDRAHRIDPTLSYTAYDRWDYTTGIEPSRETVLDVWGSGGSHEGITLAMRGDQVEGFIPGRTMYHWQTVPVVVAYDSLKRDEAEETT
jgi:hypothetical protein